MRTDAAWFVDELERLAGHGPSLAPVDLGDSYTGSRRPFYRVDVPGRRRLAKAWLAATKRSDEEVVETATALLAGVSYEERSLGPMLLQYHAGARRSVPPEQVEWWLADLVGWAEVDGMCQSAFTADDLLARWPAWKRVIVRMTASDIVSQRRGALVLLTGPVGRSDDARLAALAFEVVDRLAADRDPLVTKAVSWLLRSLTKRHAGDVAGYLAANEQRLPAVAVRETRTKLRTGTKSGR
jgi:3-methyladenine DNA glycosylase AlkD